MWVGPLVVKELKRIVEQSEIIKYDSPLFLFSFFSAHAVPLTRPPPHREDDTNWPKKNIVGKQELEIRVGNDHIAFEVRVLHNSRPWARPLISPLLILDGENRFVGRYSG